MMTTMTTYNDTTSPAEQVDGRTTATTLEQIPRMYRREWKYNKPHLSLSTSLPALQPFPTGRRPIFTCLNCGFTNTVIDLCLWCCWSSEEAKTAFERSTPRRRCSSAPSRFFWHPASQRSVPKGTRHRSQPSSTPISVAVLETALRLQANPTCHSSIDKSIALPDASRVTVTATPDDGGIVGDTPKGWVTTETTSLPSIPSMEGDWLSSFTDSGGLTSSPSQLSPNCSGEGSGTGVHSAVGVRNVRQSTVTRLPHSLSIKEIPPTFKHSYNSDTTRLSLPLVYIHDNTRQPQRHLHSHTPCFMSMNMNSGHYPVKFQSERSRGLTNKSIPSPTQTLAKPIPSLPPLAFPTSQQDIYACPSSAPLPRTIRRKTSITCLRSQTLRASAPPPRSKTVFQLEPALAPRAQSLVPRHRPLVHELPDGLHEGSAHSRSLSQPSSVRVGHPQRPYYSVIRKNMPGFSPVHGSQSTSPFHVDSSSVGGLTPALSPTSATWQSRSSSPSPSSLATPWSSSPSGATFNGSRPSRCVSRASSYGRYAVPGFLDVDIDDEEYLFASLTPAARAQPPAGACASDPYLGTDDGYAYHPLGLNLGFGAVAHEIGTGLPQRRKSNHFPGVVGGGQKPGYRFGQLTKSHLRKLKEAASIDVVPSGVRKLGRGLKDFMQGKKTPSV